MTKRRSFAVIYWPRLFLGIGIGALLLPQPAHGLALLVQKTPGQGGFISPDVGVYQFAADSEVTLEAAPRPGGPELRTSRATGTGATVASVARAAALHTRSALAAGPRAAAGCSGTGDVTAAGLWRPIRAGRPARAKPALTHACPGTIFSRTAGFLRPCPETSDF